MAGADLLLLPDDVRLGDVAAAAGTHRHRVLAVDAGVGDVDDAVANERRRADVAGERLDLPQLLAVVGIEAVDGAGAVEDQLLLAAGQIGDGGRGPAVAVDGRLPQALAGVLVEGDEGARAPRWR